MLDPHDKAKLVVHCAANTPTILEIDLKFEEAKDETICQLFREMARCLTDREIVDKVQCNVFVCVEKI